ncbi:hypothetical protein VSR01_19730 [Actinacidiphila sp. DG2A-62]|jgi:hypothetical protein|uniref:hypothetical protein n=1 Tax=Actinacidiphila sp. DG2A-62 TaxID=3108821 RepID=UPI002DC04388|nr:hypothetical protein [Actinacidiphila sp. DG2A-62]MEC3995632.1 hypothetical protein [Actinacidiphila sp. DG2A-62]
MAQQHAARPAPAVRTHRLTFNTDGRPHPLENSFVAVTAVLGLIAVITCAFHSLHVLTTWTGLAGLLTGAYGQFISATTAERYVLIVSLGMAGLGFYLGMAHGGLW